MSEDRLRSELMRRALAGNGDAVAHLLAGYPERLPKATIRAWRDSEIRAAYRALRSEDGTRSENFCVEVIAAAGGSATGSRSPLLLLSRQERFELQSRIDSVLEVTGKWLNKSQIRQIAVSSFTPVATENEGQA